MIIIIISIIIIIIIVVIMIAYFYSYIHTYILISIHIATSSPSFYRNGKWRTNKKSTLSRVSKYKVKFHETER